MKKKKTGKIFIMSGPSGSGKTTLYDKLLRSNRRLVRSISATTRPKRKHEKNGREYLFISKKMFDYKKSAGHFLESMKVFDNYYGTPKRNVVDLLKSGKNVLLCIDVKGAKVVWRKFPKAVTIFIKTPSMKVLKKRLTARGSEDKNIVSLRLATAKKELKEASKYKHVIVNDNLSTATKRLLKIVSSELAQD